VVSREEFEEIGGISTRRLSKESDLIVDIYIITYLKKNRAGVDLMNLGNYVCHSTNRLTKGELIVHSNTL